LLRHSGISCFLVAEMRFWFDKVSVLRVFDTDHSDIPVLLVHRPPALQFEL
jgi:hypothetical protein